MEQEVIAYLKGNENELFESNEALGIYAIPLERLKKNFSEYSFRILLSKQDELREKVLGPLIFQITTDLRDHLHAGAFNDKDHQRVKDVLPFLEKVQSNFSSYDDFCRYANNPQNAQPSSTAELILKANERIPEIAKNLTEAFERLKKFIPKLPK